MLAVEGSRSVRLFVLAVLTVATTGIFVISMRANYLYGRSIGQSPETQEAMAWANVGADIWKAFGLIIVAGLWRNRRRRAAAATFCAWAICLCFSVMSAIGIYVQERTTLTGGRQVQQADLADARAELAALEEQLKSRGQQSTPSEVEAAIAALLARPVIVGERARGTVGGMSNNCTRADPRTLTICAEIATLQRALASARETMTLAERASHVRNRIRILQDRGAALPADPVGQFWTWLSRGALSAEAVAFGMPLFFALMIEFVSSFGPVGIAAYAEATRRVTAGHAATHPVAVGHGASQPDALSIGRVIDYFSEHTEPADADHAISLSDLHRGYQQWCANAGVQPLSETAFSREFDAVRELPQLVRRIRKFGTRYYGIKLTPVAHSHG